jgi:two-component system LytT family response regulator
VTSREIRAVLVDDEPVARAGIRQLLAQTDDIQVVAEAGSGSAAVRAILEHRPDLLFLDIQMPEMTGFDVLHAIGPAYVPAVIFVTAYDRFALRAFEVQALDYLLKPFDDERFAAVLDRARLHLQRAREHDLADRLEALLEAWSSQKDDTGSRIAADAPTRDTLSATATAAKTRGEERYLSRIVLRESGRVSFQPVHEIDWIEAADYYVRIHVGKASHLLRESLAALEEQLDPRNFLRVHRSAIVNVRAIREMRPDWRNRHELVLASGAVVPLSRKRKRAVERVLSST